MRRIITIIFLCLCSASCAGGAVQKVPTIDETVVALRAFVAGTGAGDPSRQMDADVSITDRLDADGRYSERLSNYNLKSVYDEGALGGMLIDGVFQIDSDIEELNSLSAMTIYMGPDGTNFAIVNGEKTEPHSDFLFFVACTRLGEKVAEIDQGYIKSVGAKTADGVTEYTLVIDGEGLYKSPDLFNFFVTNTFREESVSFEVGDMVYRFSVDGDGAPLSFNIRIAVSPVDEEENISDINTEVGVVFNSFENVKIAVPEIP
jgi:hypothetical protein